MKKIKLLVYMMLVLGLFFANSSEFVNAFGKKVECQPPLTKFSDGNSTFPVSFPPGGGTNSDAKIKLPKGATVYSVKVDMKLTDPSREVKTPFIWIPNSDSNTLAQMRTSNGTIVRLFEAGDTALCGGTANFNNPSRITVMPGGDVWVANRGNSTVTRLSPKEGTVAGGTCGDGVCNVGENNGSCPQDCEEYEVNCNYGVGSGARGATYDVNGNIWIGGTGDTNMYKFASDGNLVWGPKSFGIKTYGMIGDAYGYVWISDNQDGEHRACRININTEVKDCTDISRPYGIGMDNEGDIWFGNCSGRGVIATQVGGANSGSLGSDITPSGLPGYPGSGYSCGLAVDQNNVVWVTHCSVSPGEVWAINQDGTQLSGSPFRTGNLTRGIAVDFDGNIWAVNRGGGAPSGKSVLNPSSCSGGGSVTKLASDGSYIATYKTCGNNPYCYSDMTGLRTTPKSLTLEGTKTFLSGNTFTICSDGATTCEDPSSCQAVGVSPVTCDDDKVDAFGNCEIPLKIFSATVGDYTLQNLEVIYGKEVPITIGGLVPCGRKWNDPNTSWNDTDNCNLCYLVLMMQLIIEFLVKLAAVVAAFFLSVAGYYYIFAAGNPEKITLAKKIFTGALTGFLIILISWIAVDSTLMMFGYIDPLENNQWYVMCGGESSVPPVPPPSAGICGDGVRQTPNSAGFDEECDTDGSSCASGVCLDNCVCQEELKAIGDDCDSSDECDSGICGTDADGDNYFSVALGHTGTCQADSHPYTDCDDSDASIYPGTTGTYGCNTTGACAGATRTCQSDGTYTECSILPTTEIRCNGIDEDCDGSDAAHYYNCNPHDCCTQCNTKYTWISHCNDGNDQWVPYCESSGVTCSTTAVENYTGNSLCADHGGCDSTEYKGTDGTSCKCGCHTPGTCYDTCCN